MADLDSLSIQISADAANAVRSINNLAKALDTLNTSLGKLDISKLSSLSNALNEVASASERLSAGSSAIKDFAKSFKDFEKASEGVKKARKATDDLANSTGSFEGAGTALRAMTEPMYQMSIIGNALATVFERLVQAMSGLNEYASVSNVFAQIGGSSQRLIEDMGIIDTTFREIPEPALMAAESVDDFAEAVERAASDSGAGNEAGIQNVARNLNSVLTPAKKAKIYVKALEEGFRTFGSTVKSAGSHFAVFAKKTMASATGLNGFKKFAESAKGSVRKLAKEITRIAKMLKLMITRMVLRQVISGIGDGFKNLAQYSKQFDATISLLWNDFRQLGNSIAAAASPLINVFAPAIHAIIQLVIQAVNAINQLLSAITGLTSFVRAKKLTDSYAASLDKSNKSARALKKTVLGFDELNQLQDNNKSGGGTSPLDMFEKAPIDDKWKDWAAKIKKMWETGDFTELGSAIGNWLLNALESIPWNKIKAKAYKIGKSIATLLNGIIETPKLGRTIGKSLAEAINTGVMLVNGFVRNFHWDSLGKFIGETFNGFFENIDWYYIKDTVVTGLRGIAIAIQNFIDTFNWDNISSTVINALDTLSSGIKAFFENIDWKDLGKKFGQQIKKILNDTDWKQVGEAIGDILQAAIDFAASTLEQLSWSDVINALTDLLSGFFSKVDKGAIAKIIAVILGGAMLLGVGKMALTATGNVFMKKLEAKIAEWLGAKAVTDAAATAGVSLGSVLGSALAVGAAAVVGQQLGNALGKSDFVQSIFPNTEELYDQYQGISGFFRELKDLGVAAADYVKMAWSGELDENNFYASLSREEQEYFQALQVHYGQDFHDIALEQLGVFTSYAEAWKQLKGEAKGYYDEVHDKLNKLSAEADKTKEVTSKIYDSKAAESFKNMNDRATELKDTLTHIQDTKAAEHFKTMTENMSKNTQSVKDFGTEVQKTTESISTSTQKITEEIPTEVATSLTEVSTSVTECETAVSGSMDNIKKTVDDSMLAINDSLETVKSGLTKEQWTFDGVAEGLKETFRRAREGIKSEWNQIANTLNGNHTVGTSSININLPKFANGGFPSQGSMFIAGERGAELVGNINGRTAVANNDQITNGIAQAVFNAMTSAQSSNGGQYINNTIMVDGMVLARAVTKGQNDMNRRYSPTMA